MMSTIASILTDRPVRPYLAMTGEITLRGKVLPVGGIKEKILAARRAGIKEIILCKENKKDVEEVEKAYVEGLTFHYVGRMTEVLELALMPAAPVSTIKKEKVAKAKKEKKTTEKNN
jgi:ATP-dependent Lon protease